MSFAPLAHVWLLAAMAGIAAVLVVVGLVAVVRRRSGGGRWARRGVLVLLIACSGVNPVFGNEAVTTGMRDVDVVFAIDTTASSAAEDFAGARPRIDGMRADVREVVAAFPGARFAIVGFDRTTSLLLPWTQDAAAAAAAVDVVRPEIAVYSAGTRLDAPVDVLADVLTSGGASDRTRVLVYLGDGEATSGGANARSFARLRRHVDGGAVLGYGTRAGGPMRATTGASLEPGDYLRDGPDGPRVTSRIDEAALRGLARELDVPYAHRSGSGTASRLVEVTERRGDTSAIRITTQVERGSYWLFAIAAGALVLTELLLVLGPVRDARRLPGGRG